MKELTETIVAEGGKPPSEIPSPSAPTATGKPGYRWKICALLFFATTLNYMDRHVISILAPELQRAFAWSETDYGYIVAAFQAAYGLGVVFLGKLLDSKGVRFLYAVAVFVWSLAGIAHAFAGSVMGFMASRFALGLGESANFPAALKTVSEWFPAKERALVAGIFNAGSNVGIIATAMVVPWLAAAYGWQWAFIVIGTLGFIWIVFWLAMYRAPEQHPRLTAGELNYINDNQEKEAIRALPWKTVLARKETIIICVVRFISDPTWWFLLFWLPKFLNEKHGITLVDVGLPMIIIYVIADTGSIAGGWLSSQLIKKKKSIDFARKITLLICALGVLPIVLASQTANVYLAIGVISLGAAAHTGWMANVYAVISDVFPRQAIGAVTGVSVLCAVAGGMAYATAVGYILQLTGSYFLIFIVSGFSYLTAWIILKVGIKEIKPIRFDNNHVN